MDLSIYDRYYGPTDYKEYMKDYDIDAMRDPFAPVPDYLQNDND